MSTMPTHQDDTRNASLAVLQQDNFSLKQVIDDMFLVLTDKERDVIIKRFSLDNKPRQTLDKIGKYFSVTRERIRQIENIALSKLRRTVGNTKLRLVNKLAKELIAADGGVMLESDIVNKVLQNIYSASQVDRYIIVLSLNCDADLIKSDRTATSEAFWIFKEIPLEEVQKITEAAIASLRKFSDVMTEEQVISAVQNLGAFRNRGTSSRLIISCLKTDNRARKLDDGRWGLMEWRHVNPRSIRDKAAIVLEKAKEPLHFVEIANRIAETGFDKKVVTVQAVHNELIRYEQFVLVGRGLYALAKWGYEPGTVAEVIEKLLQKNGSMTKKQIVEEVMKQRQVKIGTISLNLQKNPQFIRVGRAVYDLNTDKQ